MNIFKKAFLCLITVMLIASLTCCNKNDGEQETDSEVIESQDNGSGDVSDNSGSVDSTENGGGDNTDETAKPEDIKLGDENKEWETYYPIN